MINVAVIGAGNMGKHHARVYSELPGANLVAVCDSDEGRAKTVASRHNCKPYTDYNEMLQKEGIDAVSIAVPTKFHKDISLACIENGNSVLVEKPIADTVENAEMLIEAAGKKNVTLTVGHLERFNPAVQKLKQMIDSGEFGKINSIVAKRVGAFPPQIKDANVIVDMAIHDIDIFNYLIGRAPVRVNINSGKALINQRDDFADILIDYGRINAFVQANWITPVKIRNLTVTGDKGYAELNYITQELVVYRSKSMEIDNFNDVVKFGTPEKSVIEINTEEPLKLELAHFLDCVGNGKKPLVTGEDGLLALKVALNTFGIHPTADVSGKAVLGNGTKVWHHSHIREEASIGENCVIGKNVYVDFAVKIGNNVKIQNNTSIYHGTEIGDGAFIGTGVVFTNDKVPRATTPDGNLKQACDWSIGKTCVGRCASIGAGSIILPDVKIGEYAMIGAGSVVTKNVPAHALVFGNPAQVRGYVCKCGRRAEKEPYTCERCKK